MTTPIASTAFARRFAAALTTDPRQRLLDARADVLSRDRRGDLAAERHADPMDRLAATVRREATAALVEADRQQLQRIDAALDRISAGDYGTCEDCGCDIAKLRLDAAPWAECCTRCQSAREVRA